MTSRKRIGAVAALAGLPLWRAVEGRDAIARDFRFPDFAGAFAFMTATAAEAERLDHHPEWRNIYDRVEVILTTHSTGGVSALDVALATLMDETVTRFC